MSTIDPNSPTSSPGDQRPAPRRRRGRTMLAVAALVAGGVAIGSAATSAFSHGMFGHGMRGWHHAGFMDRAGVLDPARVDERIERGLKHFAIEAETTPEQTQKLTAIAKAAARDLLPLREQAQNLRKQAAELMTQPTVDRAQIEKLRADQMARMDTASKRVSQALADAAEVLTPEQRKKLVERIQERRSHWRRG